MKYDWKKELEPNSDQLEPDSREKLEAEIDEWCAEHFNSSFSGTAFNLFLSWLDRQAAITWQKMDDTWTAQKTEIADLRRKIDELEQESTVGGGTAEDWYRVVHKKNAEIDELQARLDELGSNLASWRDRCWGAESERDELQTKLDDYDETHMLLPVDADGVPIRIGDTMYTAMGDMVVVNCVCDDGFVGDAYPMYFAEDCHHVNPRTLEDVLHDFAHKAVRIGMDGGVPSDIELYTDEDAVAEYAAEIRELLEVDE